MTKGDAKRRAQARRARDVQEARRDAAAFVAYAFRHEETGRRLRNAEHHLAWHKHLSANAKAVIIAPVEHGKTVQISVGRVLHALGNDPTLRVAIISDTSEQAEKVIRAIRQAIEENPRVREVFPDLRPSKAPGDPWHGTALTVERPILSRDPSVQGCGIHGAINGARLDLIVVDDGLDFESTRTADQRAKLIDWIDSTVLQRQTKRGRVWVIGTPWHPEDLLHNLAERPGFALMRFGAVLNPHDNPRDWIPRWPAAWPLERLLERYRDTLEHNFQRKLLCIVRADRSARFKAVWVELMKRLGKGRTMLTRAPRAAGGMRELPCYTGVDLGVGMGARDGLTCLFTLAIDERGRRLVVDVQSGRWTAPEILDRLSLVRTMFGAEVFVESNAAQRFLVQMAQQRFPVTGLHTGANKHHEAFGVESLGLEMRSGWWVLPSGADGNTLHPEARAWCSEVLHYDPTRHTGDRLMASWIAREGARRFGAPMVQQVDLQRR